MASASMGGADRPPMDEAGIAAGMAAWKKWMTDHAASVADLGGPLGKTKLIGPGGISDIRNDVSGFLMVKAEDQQAAAAMFLNHPHFTLFPGTGIEVMEVLPIPT